MEKSLMNVYWLLQIQPGASEFRFGCETEFLAGKTYLFKNISFRSNHYSCYLNILYNLPCFIEQVAAFTKSLAESDPAILLSVYNECFLQLLSLASNSASQKKEIESAIVEDDDVSPTYDCVECKLLNVQDVVWIILLYQYQYFVWRILFSDSKTSDLFLNPLIASVALI